MKFGGGMGRMLAFFRKDLVEVLRQPRLLLTLVAGPFLILLVFGVGFAPEPQNLETILVVPAGSGLEDQSESLAATLGSRIDLAAISSDETEARARLAAGEADVVVVVPTGAVEMVRNNQQVPIAIYHRQIDPFESSFIEIFANAAVDEINQEILEGLVTIGQEEAATYQDSIPAARIAVDSMVVAAERGDEISPSDRLQLQQSLLGVAALVAARSGIINGIEDVAGIAESTNESLTRAQNNSARLTDARPTETPAILAEIRDDLDLIEQEVAVFQNIEPEVLVSPFVPQLENVQGIEVDFSHYYVPGVVALLLQHLALTFAALSLVRERALGSVELFRVSPLTAGEALIGKYLAYLLLGGLVGASLTAAAVAGFGFTIAGQLAWYLGILGLVLMASLGIGFVISALARTESEAVQYAMIALLVSIFFSGFFIPLDRLIEPVRVISYLLPATYGIAAVQDVAFLGEAPDLPLVVGVVGLASVTLFLAWALMRKRVVAASGLGRFRRSSRQSSTPAQPATASDQLET